MQDVSGAINRAEHNSKSQEQPYLNVSSVRVKVQHIVSFREQHYSNSNSIYNSD
jgi:hypothetical protein